MSLCYSPLLSVDHGLSYLRAFYFSNEDRIIWNESDLELILQNDSPNCVSDIRELLKTKSSTETGSYFELEIPIFNGYGTRQLRRELLHVYKNGAIESIGIALIKDCGSGYAY